MEWFETETRAQIAETAGRFASREFPRGRADRHVQGQEVPWEALRGAAAAGLLSGVLPEDLGGIGLDAVSAVILWDRLAAGQAGTAALVGFHAAALSLLADLRGIPAVKEWLGISHGSADADPPLLGLALPEPVVGVEAPALPRIDSASEGKAGLLSGSFLCLPGPGAAARLVILVPAGEDDSAVLWVEGRGLEPFVSISHPGSGLLELPSNRLSLRGDLPGGTELLCAGRRARELCDLTLCRVRLALAAVQTGNAEAAWREALEYSRQRVQTGRLICEHQEVRRMLADMECLVQACRSLAYRAAALLDGAADGRRAAGLAAQAHRFCDGAAEEVCLNAVQVLGGYGYMKDYGVEKRLRDCKSLQAILGSRVADWLGEG